MYSASLSSFKCCARSVAGVIDVLMVMDDRMRTNGVHMDFTGEKLQCSLRFSGPEFCSNLDDQACSEN